MKKIPKPSESHYALYYQQYIDLVHPSESVLDQLKHNAKEVILTLKKYDEHTLSTPYASGKWSPKDLIQHMIDVERVFVYRALRYSRNDKSPLPFFDENEFAFQANANRLKMSKIIKEYSTCRQATLALFNNLDASRLKRTGIAGNYTMSVSACAWIICGHEIHHVNTLNNLYGIR